MTTSTDDTILEPEAPRSINEIIDLPYSQMSEDEIELVVEFKADRAAQEAKYKQEIEMIQENLDHIAQVHLDMAQKASSTLNELTAHALKRLEEEG